MCTEAETKRQEVTRDWCCSPDVIRVMTSIRKRWAEHVARMWEKRNIDIVLVVILKERDQLKDTGVDGRVMSYNIVYAV
jgi:hypothetical protein